MHASMYMAIYVEPSRTSRTCKRSYLTELNRCDIWNCENVFWAAHGAMLRIFSRRLFQCEDHL